MAATRPSVRDDLTICEIDGEAVIFDPRGSELHYMNHSAALVLDLCDGSATMKEMAAAIADVYEMRAEEVEKQVRSIVRKLRGYRLLEPSKATPADEEPAAEEDDGLADERKEIRMQVPRSS